MTYILILIISVLSVSTSHATEREELPELVELCKYDKFCARLKNADGTFIQPKAGMLKVLEELRSPARVIAHKLGVDSRALIGGILAENSMNVAVDQDIHSFLEKVKLNPVANATSQLLRGKSFSLGMGQIKPESALEAEPLLAKVEGRARRGLEEVRHELLNPMGSLRYAAAIIRHCQDQYESRGISVKQDAEVLATLYNLGDCATRAQEAKDSGRKPRVNFFGAFVRKYKDQIEKAADFKRPYDPKEERTLLAVADPSIAPKSPKFQKTLNRYQQLHSHPPQCQLGYGGNGDDYSRGQTMQRGEVLTSKAAGDYDVISNGVDCDLRDWSLVRTLDGKTGWAPADELAEKTKDRVVSDWGPSALFGGATACRPDESRNCTEKIIEASKGNVLGAADNFLEIRLVGGKESRDAPKLSSFSVSCLRQEVVYGSNSFGGGSQIGIHPSDIPKLSGSEADELMSQIQSKKSEIANQFGFKEWENKKNPFANTFARAERALSNICKKGCRGDKAPLVKLLSMDFGQYRGFKGYQEFSSAVSALYLQLYPEPVESVKAPASGSEAVTQYFERLDTKCSKLIGRSKEFKERISRLRESFAKASELDPKWMPRFFPEFVGDPQDPVTTCRILGLHTDDTAKMEADGCEECSVAVHMKLQTGTMTTSLNSSVIQTILTDDKDILEVIEEQLKQLEHQIPQGASKTSSPECSYDPTESLKRIEALLKLDCVESAFVPDKYLINKSKNFSGRILYKAFESDDRFAIRLKKNCGEKKK